MSQSNGNGRSQGAQIAEEEQIRRAHELMEYLIREEELDEAREMFMNWFGSANNDDDEEEEEGAFSFPDHVQLQCVRVVMEHMLHQARYAQDEEDEESEEEDEEEEEVSEEEEEEEEKKKKKVMEWSKEQHCGLECYACGEEWPSEGGTIAVCSFCDRSSHIDCSKFFTFHRWCGRCKPSVRIVGENPSNQVLALVEGSLNTLGLDVFWQALREMAKAMSRNQWETLRLLGANLHQDDFDLTSMEEQLLNMTNNLSLLGKFNSLCVEDRKKIVFNTVVRLLKGTGVHTVSRRSGWGMVFCATRLIAFKNRVLHRFYAPGNLGALRALAEHSKDANRHLQEVIQLQDEDIRSKQHREKLHELERDLPRLFSSLQRSYATSFGAGFVYNLSELVKDLDVSVRVAQARRLCLPWTPSKPIDSRVQAIREMLHSKYNYQAHIWKARSENVLRCIEAKQPIRRVTMHADMVCLGIGCHNDKDLTCFGQMCAACCPCPFHPNVVKVYGNVVKVLKKTVSRASRRQKLRQKLRNK